MADGLGNAVYMPKTINYRPDGTGRDVHCMTHQRQIDTFENDMPKFNTNLTGKSGRHKSPNAPTS